MSKPRKMLNNCDTPHIQALMRLIPTQSKPTVAKWAVAYAECALLPLWEKYYPDDDRPRLSLHAARETIAGTLKWNTGLNAAAQACNAASANAEDNPAPRAAARAIAQCSSAIHSASHALGLALYGALALAYDELGFSAPWPELEARAETECGKMLAALKDIAVENEPKPCKTGWEC
ncbi:MAG: hypothetical protein LBQ91_06925 [Oscillospiraceae bacterium]|jgi:hypothetical protein|nr:hypothetical protein [Oscillospiraceae bacterium]